ncbi:MAG: B12-binding domain-containing radical SAM protein [Deltaproteobacteria bacterium]|nr:B12-binding domain-containing radical SAM protein [Deltaproteobacteria bacterium]
MKKVLLIYPYFIDDRIHVEEISPPPIGLYSVAAVLKEKDYDVEILDWHEMSGKTGEMKEILRDRKPDVIGVSLFHGNRWGGIEVARIAKAIDPGITIVFGGIGATFLWEHLLANFRDIDFVVLGEGEHSFLRLLQYLEREGSPGAPDIPGIAYRDHGIPNKTSDPEPIKDLDALPIPAKYYAYQHVSSSRGCAWDCAFCGSPKFWGRRIRFRSPRHFVEELSLLYQRGHTFFYFSDDTFTLDRERAIGICKSILEQGLDITWYAISRVDCVDEEILYWMRKAGCIQISYGIESGSERIRRVLNKRINRNDILRAFRLTRRYGILPRAYFMYGSPGETDETIGETITLINEIKPLSTIFYVLDLFPGTRLFESVKERMGLTDEIWLKKIEGILYFEVDPAISRQKILDYGKRLREAFYNHLHLFADADEMDLVDRKDLYPFHADFLSRLAMTFSHGDYAKVPSIKGRETIAQNLYESSLRYHPNQRAYLGLAIIKQKRRAFRDSLVVLNKGLRLFPESKSLHVCAGISHMNLGEYDLALSHFSPYKGSPEVEPYLSHCRKALAHGVR